MQEYCYNGTLRWRFKSLDYVKSKWNIDFKKSLDKKKILVNRRQLRTVIPSEGFVPIDWCYFINVSENYHKTIIVKKRETFAFTSKLIRKILKKQRGHVKVIPSQHH